MTVEELISAFLDEEFTFHDEWHELLVYPKIANADEWVEQMARQWWQEL